VYLGGYPPLHVLSQSIHSKVVTRKVFKTRRLQEADYKSIFRINGLQWINLYEILKLTQNGEY
jgi:hypothetical protein